MRIVGEAYVIHADETSASCALNVVVAAHGMERARTRPRARVACHMMGVWSFE